MFVKCLSLIPLANANCQDGIIPTIEGSCTVVRDFTDFCFHSYFSYMDELIEEIPADENPVDIK